MSIFCYGGIGLQNYIYNKGGIKSKLLDITHADLKNPPNKKAMSYKKPHLHKKRHIKKHIFI